MGLKQISITPPPVDCVLSITPPPVDCVHVCILQQEQQLVKEALAKTAAIAPLATPNVPGSVPGARRTFSKLSISPRVSNVSNVSRSTAGPPRR